MDEPLCFVHFINASTCSHKESGGCCSGLGTAETPGGCSALPTFIPWEGQWEVKGVESLGSQGSGPLTVKWKKQLPCVSPVSSVWYLRRQSRTSFGRTVPHKETFAARQAHV